MLISSPYLRGNMICFCLKVPCRNLLWRIHSRFEVRTWTAMMLCIELRGWMVMMVAYVMRHLCCNDCSCRQSRQYLRAQSGVGFGACLHIHFTENLGEEFHAMVVIHRQELVVVLLLDFVRDSFTIDDGGHAILGFAFLFSLCWRYFLHHNITDFHLTSVRSLTIPTLVLINQGKVFTSHHGIALQHVTSDSLVLFQRKQPFLVLLLTLLQLLSIRILSAKSSLMMPFSSSKR